MTQAGVNLAAITGDALEDLSLILAQNFRARTMRRLRGLLWWYIALLIFEGAVRKWIHPLSVPFLVIRDPIAVLIWYYGRKLNIGPPRAWLAFYGFAGLITVLGFLQIVGADLSPVVALYGWRSYALHIPVIIVFASLLSAEDIRKIAEWTLRISIPMVLLMILQYLSSPTSLLNIGASEGGVQIGGALGHIRPAGTFSYITGPIQFIPLALCFLLWGVITRQPFPRWLLIGSAVALLAAQPVSVSRSLVIMTGMVLAVAAIGLILRGGIAFNPETLPRIVIVVVIGAIVVASVFQIPVVRDASNTFMVRWTQGQGDDNDDPDATDPIVERSVNAMAGGFDTFSDSTPLGVGIGAGSQVAAALQNIDQFRYGEGSLEREMLELGSFVGFGFLILRWAMGLTFIALCLRAVFKGALLSWMMMPLSVMLIISGGLDQTTAQGFLVVTVGLNLAALRLLI